MGSIQRLNLTLLVAGQHQSVLRWIEVQSVDMREFSANVGSFETLNDFTR